MPTAKELHTPQQAQHGKRSRRSTPVWKGNGGTDKGAQQELLRLCLVQTSEVRKR